MAFGSGLVMAMAMPPMVQCQREACGLCERRASRPIRLFSLEAAEFFQPHNMRIVCGVIREIMVVVLYSNNHNIVVISQ